MKFRRVLQNEYEDRSTFTKEDGITAGLETPVPLRSRTYASAPAFTSFRVKKLVILLYTLSLTLARQGRGN
jgi:hypothetical protein